MKFSMTGQGKGDLLIRVLISNAVDHGFEPLRVKPKTMKFVFVASPLSMQLYGIKAKTGWLGIRIFCQNGATCLPVDCCLSQLAL